MTIGERIRQRRMELGLTQEELAIRLGNKTRAAVCRVEKDKEDLTTERIKKYAEALGCEPAYLVGWKDKTPREPSVDYIIYDRISEYSQEDITRALDFLDAFQKASPETRSAIEILLKSRQSDS